MAAETGARGHQASDRTGNSRDRNTIDYWSTGGAAEVTLPVPGRREQSFGCAENTACLSCLGRHGPTWNVSLFKDFRPVEQLTLQFRAESFNVLNHPQFGQPTLPSARSRGHHYFHSWEPAADAGRLAAGVLDKPWRPIRLEGEFPVPRLGRHALEGLLVHLVSLPPLVRCSRGRGR